MNTGIAPLFYAVASPSDSRQGQALPANGSDDAFSNLLGQITGNHGAEPSPQSPDASLLLPLLLTQGMNSQEETDEEQLSVDIGQWLESLKQWLDNPEMLKTLEQLAGFKEWAAQTHALLAATGWGQLAHSYMTETVESQEQTPQVQGQTQSTPVQQTQQTILQFFAAMEEQPDSELLAQLKDKLSTLLAPAIREVMQAASTRNEAASVLAGTGQTTDSAVKQRAPETATVSTAEGAKGAAGKNTVEPVLAQQFRTALESVQKTDMLARLEALAYRSGYMERQPVNEAVSAPVSNYSTAEALPVNPPVMMDSVKFEVNRQGTQPPQPLPMSQTMERFFGEMQGFVVRSMLTTKANGVSEAKIALYPEHLGHVDVKITLSNGQLTAQLTAHTMAGKEMLEAQLAQLRANLQNQGIHVERLDVAHADSNLSHAFGEQQQQAFQQFSRNVGRAAADSDFLEDELLSAEELGSLQKELYGNEFNASV